MSVRKALSPLAFLVFPLALLVVYWENAYFDGHPLDRTIHLTTFLGLAVLLVLEALFRYENAVSQRQLASRDIVSTAVNVFITGAVGSALFVPVILFVLEVLFGRNLVFATSAELGPLWVQLVLAALLYELLRYSIHRVQHIVPFLWELHSYHHSVTDLKASNTFVSHPIDYALRNVLPPVILAFVGFDPAAILFGVSLVTAASLMSHCGAGLNAGWLNRLFVTPQVHRWHHSARVPDGHKYSVNYGVGLVVWDRLFGTYYLPMKNGVAVQPDKLGHPDGVADERNYLKLFFLTRYLPKWPRPAK